ncbi:hypothetical protein Tco_0244484, partial [Tanacetum coccineum]
YIRLPLWTQDLPFSSSSKDSLDVGFKPSGEEEKKDVEYPRNEGGNLTEEGERVNQEKDASVNSINTINTTSPTVNAASIEDTTIYDTPSHNKKIFANMRRPRKTKRATKISQSSGPISLVADETVTKEREDRMEVEQDS